MELSKEERDGAAIAMIMSRTIPYVNSIVSTVQLGNVRSMISVTKKGIPTPMICGEVDDNEIHLVIRSLDLFFKVLKETMLAENWGVQQVGRDQSYNGPLAINAELHNGTVVRLAFINRSS